jgi:hypothetical protein
MKKLILLLFTFFLVSSQLTVKAETLEPKVTLPFTASLNLPSNQVEGVRDYFNLNMKSNETQEISITIHNTSSNPISLKVKPSNAITSTQGGIVYVDDRGNNLATLTDDSYFIDNYLTLPSDIDLQPNESKNVPITIKTPSKDIGTILGGVLFIPQESNSVEQKTSRTDIKTTANAKIRLNVPIQVNLPNMEKESPLKVDNIKQLAVPSGVYVSFELENPNGEVMKDISYNYEVQDEKGLVLFNGSITPFNVAPKSKVSIPIMWDFKNYQHGKYKLVLNPSYSDTPITKDFSVANKDVATYAKATGKKTKAEPILEVPYYVWIAFIVLLLALVFGAFVLGKRSKKDKDDKDRLSA